MPGLDNILKAVLNYHANMRPSMVRQFEKIRDQPEPKAVMFSCMDSRVIITRLLSADVGDMFLVRNAGNIIPHNDSLSYDSITTEPGALELGCVINGIRHVLVCGHSDCKAMNLLHSIKDDIDTRTGTPLKLWLKKHGASSVHKYNAWKERGTSTAINFQGETEDKIFEAYIDPDNQFNDVDKFSQINTLQQLQNIASHPIILDQLQKNEVRLNAFWLDIYQGRFYMFSRERKRFLDISDDTYQHLAKDGESWKYNK